MRKFDEAQIYYTHLLDQVSDWNDSTIVFKHNSIAFLDLNKITYQPALESHETALQILQRRYSEDHPFLTECYNNMALVYKIEMRYIKKH
jgi:tetratricopeptide (TPR) repeat protein